MLLVDDRVGSRDLLPYFRHLHLPSQLERLEFADVAFVGNGPSGPCPVGIEVKRYTDALQCMEDGRFAGHQLPGLVTHYDWTWLVLEGWYQEDIRTGILLAPGTRHRENHLGRAKFMYSDFDKWLLTLTIRSGVRVHRTGTRLETARFCADVFSWFRKPWDEHKAHLQLYYPGSRPDVAMFAKPPLIRMIAAQLPGIGFEKSARVVREFRTIDRMMEATPKEWACIDGIGQVLADKIWRALHA